jgi:hypothetical protein
MKYILFFVILSSCSSYEVIQSVGENQYHMYKKGKVQIIETEQNLIIGEKYNIKKVKSK